MKLQESNFEPICHNYLAHGSIQDAMAISTAASLKRIADALDNSDKIASLERELKLVRDGAIL